MDLTVIDLQCLCDGDQKIVIEKHDGYCMSVMEITQVKDLDKSEYKDEKVSLISASNNEIWIKLD
jgi:hypothetical protein